MRILSARQIREWDAYTIKHEPISSIDLMERASLAFCDWFIQKFDTNRFVKVFCGPGNNGGDGLAVSRILFKRGYRVETYSIHSDNTSEDFQINEERLLEYYPIHSIKNEEEMPEIYPDEIVIDAIFGSGLTRPISGMFASVIRQINNSEAIVVAIDIASGLFTDTFNNDENIVEPDFTVSFQMPKLSFLLPSNEKYTGELVVQDIGLDKNFLEEVESKFYFTKEDYIKAVIKMRNKFSHKGTYGTALIIGGSYGMIGAAVLASRSCLKSGVGLCVTYVPQCGYEVLQTAIPESLVKTDKEHKFISDIPDLKKYSAIAVGPGLGKEKATVNALKKLLENAKCPLVIDADALNIISENKELIKKIPEGSILTPHPKEFERLVGPFKDDYHRLDVLTSFAENIKSVVVLKGAYTTVASSVGTLYFNSTGNPGMATGGSGDVLTGIITSLLAQGYSSLDAAILGVYLHGFAGDVAAKKLSEPAMIASDIIDSIGEFFKYFQRD